MLFLHIPTDGFACSIVFLCIFEFDIRNHTADESCDQITMKYVTLLPYMELLMY